MVRNSTDVHGFQKTYDRRIISLWKTDELVREDKEGIERFLRDQKARGIGYARLIKLCGVLIIINKKLGKPFAEVTINDIKELIHGFEVSDYSFWTKHDFKVIIKQFYCWLNDGRYPHKVEWICTTIPIKQKRIPRTGDLLTSEDTEKLLDAADHPRDKALIATLSESGARIGEIGNLTIGQVDIDTNGVILTVDGKTGERRLRIVSATPHLMTWLNNHPDKKNPRAPLWTGTGPRAYHIQLSYAGIRVMIKRTFRKAGLKKRCHPYIFRHSRASQLAHHLTEFQMNAYFGWCQGSDTASIYVRVCGKELDKHILAISGLTPGLPKTYEKPKDRICPRCKTINSPTALYCSQCAEIVDPSLALKIQVQQVEKRVERIKSPFLEWVQQDPEMRDVLARKATEFREAN